MTLIEMIKLKAKYYNVLGSHLIMHEYFLRLCLWENKTTIKITFIAY